jgi:hypothetical protein
MFELKERNHWQFSRNLVAQIPEQLRNCDVSRQLHIAQNSIAFHEYGPIGERVIKDRFSY